MAALQSPFPYFGAKSRVAADVWARFGDVPNLVEPFAGSLAVLLARPHEPRIETVNDLDGFIANFWRATQADPEAVADAADWPVNECDLHARHTYLVARREELTVRLMGDPDHYDAKLAGWWCWGLCCWIGGGWCSGQGPWHSVDGRFMRMEDESAGVGVSRRLPHLGNAGRGVNKNVALVDWFQRLRDRLRRVRVCCGDWSRVCGPSVTLMNGMTAVFLDPPYSAEAGRAEVYAQEDLAVAHAVREWAIQNGDNPDLRIALCGYEGEHEMPDGWECLAWKTSGGYGGGKGGRGEANQHRERVWFSPRCLRPQTETQGELML